jgi:ABC-2 type transport system permease protein
VVEAIRLYRVLAWARVRADWQYRTSFVLFTSTQFLVTFLDFGQIAIIFGQVHGLAGWSLAEVAFLYGTSGIAFFLADAFISQVERCSQRIKMGTFDTLLIRPLGPLFQLCTEEFAFRRFGKLIQATIVLSVAIARLHIEWTAAKLVLFVTMLVSGTVIFSSLFVITSSLAFWTVDTQEIANAFTYGTNYATQYPLQIITPWLRRALTFIVPTAFVNFFPALYILDKPNPFATPDWFRFASPLVAIGLALVARFLWTVAIRHYRSTGS